MYIIEYTEHMMQTVNQCSTSSHEILSWQLDEQDLQWNAGKMSIASADGIASRGERMSWTFSVEINNADLCNHIKEESHISSGEGVIKVC